MRIRTSDLCFALPVWMFLCSGIVAAQDVLTDPPNSSSGASGQAISGSFALSNIESVNALNGIVSLNIPAAQLPPGPGGFSAGVNLVYNSSIFDLQTEVATTTGYLQMAYVPSAHGGGWNYSYQYTLWSQTRVTTFNSTTCSVVNLTEAENWYKTILLTPDGTNHVLRLVGAITSNGSTYTGTLSSDVDQSYDIYDFGGYTNLNCGNPITQAFAGTLIYASADNTFIRVETNTQTETWIAYFPNGTQVSGPINLTNQPHAVDSDANKLVDRNGNMLTLTGNCSVGTACTETVADEQGRQIVVDYSSSTGVGGIWTDSMTWPGPNGILKALVTWGIDTPPRQPLPYYCWANSTTINMAEVCSWGQTNMTVNSVQLPVATLPGTQQPPGTNEGNGVNFTMYYGPLTAQSASTYSWGELHSLTMCTGPSPTSCQPQWVASYGYRFDASSYLPASADPARPPGTIVNPIATKTLQHADTLLGAATTLNDTTTYIVPLPTNPYSYPVTTGTSAANSIAYPDGSLTTIFTTNLCPTNVASRDLCIAVPYKISNRDGSQTEMMWVSNTSAPGVPSGALFNPYVQYRVDSPAPTTFGPVKITYAQQDPNGNTTTLSEYDWQNYSVVTRNSSGVITAVCGSGCTSAVRTTTTSYYSNSSVPSYWMHGAAANLRSPQSATVGNLSTSYTYDNALTTGNLIQLTQSDSAIGPTITTHWAYLSNGNVTSQTDPNGNYTVICYDSNNLYPVTRVVGAASQSCPSPGEVTGGQTTTFTYVSNSGTLATETALLQTETDADNGVTTTFSYDNTGRQTSAVQSSSSLTRSTSTGYDDVNLIVTTTQTDTSTPLVTTTFYDSLGRVQGVTDGANNQIQQAYRYGSSCSNPGPNCTYKLASNAFVSPSDQTMGWTLTTQALKLSNALSQITVTHYRGGSAPSMFGGSNSTTTGTTMTTNLPSLSGCTAVGTQVTDEAGNTHSYCKDALGRVSSVTEPDGTVTSYSYDALDNLIGVSVGGQQIRSFTINAFGWLFSATNPESGTVSYVYDNNGNVKQITDAQGVATTLTYDALNRILTKSYSVPNGSSTAATSSVTYTYDQDFRGALSSVCVLSCTPGANTVIDAFTHDKFGRVITSTQQIRTNSAYSFGSATMGVPGYQYSLTDQLTQITYPSGRTVNYTLDAADRVQTVQNMLAGTSYASLNYNTGPGNTLTISLGNGATEQPSFNDRLQPTGLQIISSAGNLLTLGLYPCTSQVTSCASGNNGNLQSQSISIPGLFVTQTYSYDALNRLTGASESSGWTQNYSYVGNGNRWVSTNTGLPPLTPETATSASAYTSSSVLNRINTWTYDSNGNILTIPLIGSANRNFTYDAENRQVTATINTGTSTTSASYMYDGLGQRVSKTVNGVATTYVYDAFGNLAAEYGPPEASPCGTANPTPCYVTVDHLGSTRMLMDSAAVVQKRYDYQPFGMEIPAGYGSRTTAMSYLSIPDDVGPKFTSQSRDQETSGVSSSVDWFNVRYLSGAQGRFQSPDPGSAGADPSDPQTWNGYAYVGNNPFSYTDPSGFGFWSDLWSTLWNGTIWLAEHLIPGLASLGVSQGISAGLASGPWDEQVPITGVGGTVNLGSVFGQGNTGPFVFGFTDPSQATDPVITSQYFPALVQGVKHSKPAGDIAFYGTAAVATLPATVAAAAGTASGAATLAAKGVGWYYAVSGGVGVVLGRYPDYVNAAKSIGANAFNISPRLYGVLNAVGRAWTANQQFIDTSIRRGQQFYLSNGPLGQDGSTFAQELKYLAEKGVGANNWIILHLPFK